MKHLLRKLFGYKLADRRDELEIAFSTTLPCALVLLDEELKVVNYTAQWKVDFHLSKRKDREIRGKLIYELLPGLAYLQSSFLQAIKQAMFGKESQSDHYLFQFECNHFEWMQWVIKPWLSKKGKVIGVVIVARLITHKVQLEQYYKLSLSMLCTVSMKGYFLDINPAFAEILGYSRKNLLNRSFYDYVHPDDLEIAAAAISSLNEKEKFEALRIRFRGKDGRYLYLEWSAAKDKGSDIFYAQARDVSFCKLLESSKQYYDLLIENIVAIQEEFLKRRNVRQLFSDILNRLLSLSESKIGFIATVSEDESDKKYLTFLALSEMKWDRKTRAHYEQDSKNYAELHDLNNPFGEVIEKGGEVIFSEEDLDKQPSFPQGFEVNNYLGIPVRYNNEIIGLVSLMNREQPYDALLVSYLSPLVSVIATIISTQGDVVMLQPIANYDKLTGLFGRSYFEGKLYEMFEEAKKNNTRFALIFLDLSRFKSINDTYGHAIGDMILEKLGKRLQDKVDVNVVLGRIGGDEFAILVSAEEKINEIVAYAKEIKTELEKPYQIKGAYLSVKVSMGISIYPDSSKDIDELRKNTDFALYEARSNAINIQLYTKKVKEIYHERLAIESSIDRAFKNNEFYLLYQPQVDARLNKIVGLEALLRWDHKELGSLSPSLFIPIIEEMGKADILNFWVARRIAQDSRQLPAYLKKLIQLSFNFSPYVFNLQEHIHELIKVLGGAMQECKLKLEITEQNIKDPEFNLSEFSNLLIKNKIFLSIDDFGKGFSSLKRLLELPVSTIKIDMAFIHDMLTDDKTKKVVLSIINLGQSLGIDVIAEGVENNEQLNLLKSFGCYLMQGNFYYKPMMMEKLVKKL